MLRWCGLLLILSCSLHSGECLGTKQLELTAGHVYNLNCLNHFNDNVNWTRELNQEWDVGLKVIDGSLLFLPVQESHSGNYSCYFRSTDDGNTDELFEQKFSISVAKHKCPRVPSNDPPVYLIKNTPDHLSWYNGVMNKISNLGSVSDMSWTWMKDCRPLGWHDASERLRFSRVSEGDEGVYTSVLNFTLNGTSYTEVQSKQVLVIDPGPVPQKPRIITPQQETLAVKLGSKLVLNCKVFVELGSCETDHAEPVQVFWVVNNKFPEDYFSNEEDFAKNGCTTEDGAVYHHSNLTISEVKQEFFNIAFECVASSSYGNDNGTVILIEDNQRELHCTLAVVTACVVLTLGVLLYYFFKVDLVLAYRNLSPCLKQQNDGKVYDAYVSYLHANNQSVSSATTFALNVLPEMLEDQLGYKLFISGRDSIPGTAVHDVISEAVVKSRRLIFVLPSKALTTSSDNEDGLLNKMPPEHFGFNNNIAVMDPDVSDLSQLHWGPYECWVGLYDALVEESVQIILVQVGEEMDDTLLPESLRYVKRTQGILKWKQHYARKPDGSFWKQMRYRMPAVQKARTSVIV